MAYLKGSRPILLGSKEAKNLLSQSGLSIIHQNSSFTKSRANAVEPAANINADVVGELDSRQPQREGDLYCQSCHLSLVDREEQVVHYRLDWHRYNLKRRLKGLAPLSQEEFERVAGGDMSSISGSESDSDSNKENEEVKASLASLKEESDYDADSAQSKTVGSPFLYFSSQDDRCFAVYRHLVTNLKAAEVRTCTTSELLNSVTSLSQPQVWIILMRAGGHFAGSVFRGSTMVAHKTFHRYTVRAKRGTAQSVRDGHQGGHAPRSAGASLRRYNESALVAEIRELIASWSGHVEEASAIFIRTPKYGKGVFIGDGSTGSGGGNAPFSRTDPRLRNIPFATRRPTVKEAQNVHSKLATIYEVSSEQLLQGASRSPTVAKPKKTVNDVDKETEVKEKAAVTVPDEDRKINVEVELPEDDSSGEGEEESNVGGDTVKTTKKKRRRRAKKTTEPQVEIPAPVRQLLQLCKQSENSDDSEVLMTELLREMRISPITSTEIENSPTVQCEAAAGEGHKYEQEDEGKISASSKEEPFNVLNEVWNGDTALHIAAASGNTSLIPILLLHGANPTIKNKAGHTAYVVAKDKNVRDAFRRFMAQHPTSYDYGAAKVPSPLTEEMERERKEKMAEKKKAQKKAKKQKEKEHRAEMESERSKMNHEKSVAGLSEREKRALAAEKRMSAQLPNSSTILKAGVCHFCQSTLAGLVPFERLQYKYCSMDCLKNHRKQLSMTSPS